LLFQSLSELEQKQHFLVSVLETRLALLLVMASGDDHGEPLWAEGTIHDGRHPPFRLARMDTSPGWAWPSTRCGFIPHHRLPRLASYRGADFCLLTCVGLLLLLCVRWQHRWWLMSCGGSCLPGRGSWTIGNVPSLCGRMGWRLPIAPWGGHARIVMLHEPRPRLPDRTTALGYTPLLLAPSTPLTSIGSWRNA
jgi:hypothetical protein